MRYDIPPELVLLHLILGLINILAADVLATQGARASAAMIVT